MKKIILVLALLLIATPALAVRYCYKDGVNATNCQRERSGIIITLSGLKVGGSEADKNYHGYYRIENDPSQESLTPGNRWLSWVLTWNEPTSTFYRSRGQEVDPNYPTLQEFKNRRIRSEYERIDAILGEQCEYPDANGFRIPHSVLNKIHMDATNGTPESYFVLDIDNDEYVELSPNGADTAAKVATLKTIWRACRTGFISEKNNLLNDHEDTDNPSCTDVGLPWDCCTSAGTGTCDEDSFRARIKACLDLDCINQEPFDPVDHPGVT